MNIKQLFKRYAYVLLGDKYVGTSLDIERFNQNPENTYLVSFPRTGSHWLRMLMELYFERPLLTRTFYFPKRNDYLLLHTHDMDLQVKRLNVIYLYRDPVDTVYSQLKYCGESTQDRLRILHWTQRYGCHLAKWLVNEGFTTSKTIVRYENLTNNICAEFAKVTGHFGKGFDADKLEACASRVSKGEVKRQSNYNQQVMNTGRAYEEQRVEFREEQSEFVWKGIKRTFRLLHSDLDLLLNIFPDSNFYQ